MIVCNKQIGNESESEGFDLRYLAVGYLTVQPSKLTSIGM